MGKELPFMAGDGQVVRGIDWKETFPFIQIFSSFRIAIHLSKMALGLALLLSVWIGGCVLDGIWFHSARALSGEIEAYSQMTSHDIGESLSAWRDQTRTQMESGYANLLITYGVETDQTQAQADAASRAKLGDLETAIDKQRDDAIKQANSDYDTAVKNADAKSKDQITQDAAKTRDDAIVAAYDLAETADISAHQLDGVGIFASFFSYEVRQIYLIVEGIAHNSWVAPDGAIEHLYNFFAVGPVWLIFHHTVFFLIFGAWFLFVWSLFGGAISRIAAVQVARDEKISIRQAMNFAVGKLLSFASAPVIPIVIVLVIGLIVSAASLVGNVPFFGPIAVGALFVLAIVAGFIMTLVLLGTAGGFNLMYPTIAVEGSDSFDAISRSFSYVYARPWRMGLYTLVSLVYATATYLFVHCFTYMTLVLAHRFVSMGLFTHAANTRTLFSVMWPSPVASGRLAYQVRYDVLSFGQSIGAFFIHVWVMLLVSVMGAYVISIYFSANTIIYFLMRREVDSTEIDDVYLEQSPDDFDTASPPGGPETTVVTATVAVATVVPAGEESGDSSSSAESSSEPESGERESGGESQSPA
jgi:hypothetical protein